MSELEEEEMKEMSFWDHLEELRWTLFRSIIAVVVAAIAFYVSMSYLFDNVILAPCRGDFIFYRWIHQLSQYITFLPSFYNPEYRIEVININLASQFFVHLSTSFWLAIVFVFPYLIYEIWSFISPALYEHEKKNARWALCFGIVMFFLGVAVGYLVIFPMTLRFLADYQLSTYIANQLSLDSYIGNFLMLIFAMGVVFELPLVSWFMSQLGLVHKSFFRTYRRQAGLACFVVAAFITPSGDPFTMTAVALPLYLLYELSIILVKPDPVEDDVVSDNLSQEEV